VSSTTITIKRFNHRVHPCDRSQKLALLKHLIALHSDKEIVIIAARDIAELEQELDADNVTLKSDKELIENTKFQCDMIISLDLAENPESYIKRLGQTKTFALLLADDKEQQELYEIETVMKRTLTKEIISGFEPVSHRLAEAETKGLKVRQALNLEKQTLRDDKRARQQNGPSSKKREESKYLGKDENGKPIFSGKSRERNHRHDGTPKDESEKQFTPKPQYTRDNAQNSERKPWDKTSVEQKSGEKKAWDKPAGEKKPWDKTAGDKKPWDKKPGEKKAWDKPAGDKKPWDKKESTNTAEKSAPARSGRIIRIPTVKK
jgi:superfamily II DNA/RNA helicase